MLSTHQEFGGRIDLQDTHAGLSDHAMLVAGTMGAAGVRSEAEAMAPLVRIHFDDWNEDTIEMLAVGVASPTDASRLPIPNYSYGISTGPEPPVAKLTISRKMTLPKPPGNPKFPNNR